MMHNESQDTLNVGRCQQTSYEQQADAGWRLVVPENGVQVSELHAITPDTHFIDKFCD